MPARRPGPIKRTHHKKTNKKPVQKARPIVLQRVKGFEANLQLIPQVFKQKGVLGCVEVVRTALPDLERKINAAKANGAVLKGDWRKVFISKAAEALKKSGAKKAQVEEFIEKSKKSIT